jgi:hypothetical protein
MQAIQQRDWIEQQINEKMERKRAEQELEKYY